MSDLKIRIKCGDCEVEYESSNFREACDPAYVKDGYCSTDNSNLVKTVETLTESMVKVRAEYLK